VGSLETRRINKRNQPRLKTYPASVHTILRRNGGTAPPERTRRSSALTLEKREEISRGIAANLSLHAITQRINVVASTVGRELLRNVTLVAVSTSIICIA
jgi:hypothetical protein